MRFPARFRFGYERRMADPDDKSRSPNEPPVAPGDGAVTAPSVPPSSRLDFGGPTHAPAPDPTPVTFATVAPFVERGMAVVEHLVRLQARDIDHSGRDNEMSYTDAREARTEDTRRGLHRLVFGAFALLVVAGLIAMCVVLGREALAGDIVKIGGSLIAGAAGGYGYAVSRRPSPRPISASERH